MPTYAILGATGQIGGSVLQVLVQQNPSAHINCLVRSKTKLEKQKPELFPSNNIALFEGSISDKANLAACLRGTQSAFLCVAALIGKPGLRIAQDQAEAVVGALRTIREEDPQARMPTLVILSSSEAEEEPKLSLSIPWPIRNTLFMANYFIYIDLLKAEEYLREEEDWLNLVFMKPGGISHDIQRGHIVSEKDSQTFVSYLDVAGAMIEVADNGERYSGKDVSALSKGKAKIEWMAVPGLFIGLLIYMFPALGTWLSAKM